MGWLFSVALGLQQRSRKAVFVALLPVAIGHALAIGLVVVLVYMVGAVIPSQWLQMGRRYAVRYRDLETLAFATPHLGRYACQFLGSDRLVMADGERAWSRADGRAGTSRREIVVLRTNSIQH
jgi:lysylphosphatidylglycerol synthetase-like protein (DUF2156 family)